MVQQPSEKDMNDVVGPLFAEHSHLLDLVEDVEINHKKPNAKLLKTLEEVSGSVKSLMRKVEKNDLNEFIDEGVLHSATVTLQKAKAIMQGKPIPQFEEGHLEEQNEQAL